MRPDEISAWLVTQIAQMTDCDPAEIDMQAPFDACGISSSDGVILSGDLETLLGRELSPTLVYEHPSIAALADFLGADPGAAAAPPETQGVDRSRSIAIVGMACRLPGADDPAAFWRLLRDGVDAVREVPADRWDPDAFYDPDPAAPGKAISRWGGFLDRIDRFDAFFFGISPGEAERMDPQQRLLLELAFEAFEDAGYPMPRLAGSRTAVLVGISVNEYGALRFNRHRQITGHSGTGASLSIAANRISYCFDLHGPSLAVDTACSSSLAAIHLACRSLRAGECDLAIAGGVNIILSPAHAIAFTKAGVLAPDGRCKPFDARADGYVRGEGAGLVVLKPLEVALTEGDRVYAVIRGGAMAQDGRTNGLIAPNARAQEAVLREAYRDASVAPAQVRYVEAHGTGTLLGDSMEARAIGAAISRGRGGAPCRLGSVKSNLGHLEAAAGVAGLIKTALAFRHRRLPASLHFQTPNPHIPFESLGLAVEQASGPWPDGPAPAVAGVSSFGFGGTNVHLVVEDAPTPAAPLPRDQEDDRPLLIPLSAHTEAALTAVARRFRDAVVSHQDDAEVALGDLCFTTALRRTHLQHRVVLLARSRGELLGRLDTVVEGVGHPDVLTGAGRGGRTVFVFSGQGGQWPGMGRDLLAREPAFRAAVERCDRALRPHLEWSVVERLAESRADRWDEIDVVQPVLFTIQVALAALWRARGIRPDAVVGHSMGEVAAAHVAGSLTLEDAARVIAVRSRLLRRLSGQGGMVLVGMGAEETAPLLVRGGHRVSIAASNGPRSTVVSGAHEELASLVRDLESAGVFCRAVNVEVPAHGPQAEPLADELRECLADLVPGEASVDFVSTVTVGETGSPVPDAEYWARNLTEPVNFTAAVSHLLHAGCEMFLEISPHPVLHGAIQQGMIQQGVQGTVLPSLVRDEDGVTTMLRSLGQLHVSGRPIDWHAVVPAGGRLVSLPTYPWQRERFWLDAFPEDGEPSSPPGPRREDAHPLLGRRIPLAGEPGTHLWQAAADRSEGFVQDHRVDDQVVFPAAAYVEMALAAAAMAGVDHDIADLTFPHLLYLRDGEPPTLQTRLSPAPDGTLAFSVHGRPPASDEWTLHATARLCPTGAADNRQPPEGASLASLLARCPEAVSQAELYRALAARGLMYGPRLRAVEQAWRGAGEALGRITLPSGLRHEAKYFRIHPVLVDAALQTLAATVRSGARAEDETFLPAGCRSIRLFGAPGAELWSHVLLREPGTGSLEAGEICADVRLLDDSGACVGEIEECRLVRVPRARSAPAGPRDTWCYRVQWEQAERAERLPVELAGTTTWVVVAGARGLAEALCCRLEERGHGCRILDPGVDVAGAALRSRLKDRLRDQATQVTGIVYLGEEEAEPASATAASPASVAARHAATALALVQALADCGASLGGPRLWLVTRGAQAARPDDQITMGGAALWGLGKSVALEMPELRCTLVDLDPSLDPAGAAERLATELLQADAEDHVALRGRDRLVARLLPDFGLGPASCPTGQAPDFRADGTYLITGGLGGLGLTVAGWMVEHGARHVVLVGRNGVAPSAARTLDRLTRSGARVEVARTDVTQVGQVNELLARIRDTMPALRGVIHAAGVLENRSLTGLDPESLARVIAPKAAGAWHLHEATRDDPLEFFILFSSAVSVLGSPGQGNYAAANSFLDSLAHHRRARGLPASSINWGPWTEVGLVADGDILAGTPHRGEAGLKGIRPERGLDVFAWVLRAAPAQITVLPFDLATLLDLYPAAARIPLFAEVGGRDTHVSRLYARPRLREAYLAPRNDVERRLTELWRQTLRIDRVGVRDSFFELGGDSVLAAQIIASTHRTFGVEIDVQEAFQSFTIESLARRVESALVARIDALSEADVDRLLQE